MKASELKEKINAGLNYFFKNEGFKYLKGNNEYRKCDGMINYHFIIDQLSWSDHYSINVRSYISLNQIEDIFEQIVGKQKVRYTLGGDLARIKYSPDGIKVVNQTLVILIICEEDIESAIETLIQYYSNIAKPFFDGYNTLRAANNIMNSIPYNNMPAFVSGTFDTKCMKGLIVAKLVNNPKYKEIEESYVKLIGETFKDYNRESIDMFKMFVSKLSSYQISNSSK